MICLMLLGPGFRNMKYFLPDVAYLRHRFMAIRENNTSGNQKLSHVRLLQCNFNKKCQTVK